ncbi:hypothetical protein JVT61DRAFT_8861 [Boletus reticuloceps]|uniref:Uncharacterized protein n=1 Tax=Boletus reticuloceps TaxID=495285 RepID=A0A8I2YH35_9AGAM|nr:hypothetical protein JVT61DRAFT_8861 [Boletus reticuloceps]
MTDFWGRRWHQFFRCIFVFLCSRQGGLYYRDVSLLRGSSLRCSGLAQWPGRTVEIQSGSTVILVERAFKRFTGRKVGGIVGWGLDDGIPCFMMIDALARGGVFGHSSFTENVMAGPL